MKQSTIERIDSGWLLSLDQWPIGLFRSEGSTQAVASILDRVSNLPEWTPSDLCVLAGLRPTQVVGPYRNKPHRVRLGPHTYRCVVWPAHPRILLAM